jgi:hypothetical protein
MSARFRHKGFGYVRDPGWLRRILHESVFRNPATGDHAVVGQALILLHFATGPSICEPIMPPVGVHDRSEQTTWADQNIFALQTRFSQNGAFASIKAGIAP